MRSELILMHWAWDGVTAALTSGVDPAHVHVQQDFVLVQFLCDPQWQGTGSSTVL